ncbi:LCP family protein [Paenibacillus sp. BC26]|uniref:LCP family protein n=1 Tax=Paenibacillus sp. BC26 TaxID=1881032 RepID=UPI0008E86BAC|nr:LCP family protein [Paenibacillus sp. BC26]SFS85495.1 transcriptional attenuator, LytR family [Paenibacillus sp. BC26]
MTRGSDLSPRKDKAKEKRKKRYWLRRLMVLFLALLIGVAGYLGYLYKVSKDVLGEITTDADPTVTVSANQSVKVKPVTIMLLGVDTRKETGSLNTDVMMVATFNPNTKSAVVVSIPRDSKIELPGYNSRKANAYYSRFLKGAKNDGLEGKDAERQAKQDMRKMFSKYFDVPIDYTATINFQGFVDVVDALGGVDVDVDMDMRYVDNADGTNIDLKKGPQNLKGDDALDFVRYRKSNDGTNMSSDFDRNRRESQVLGEIADKLKSFSSVPKIANVIKAVGNNMRMDIPSDEVENMMKTYFGISKSDITFIPLEGEWRSPYVHLNEAKLQEAKSALASKMAE